MFHIGDRVVWSILGVAVMSGTLTQQDYVCDEAWIMQSETGRGISVYESEISLLA